MSSIEQPADDVRRLAVLLGKPMAVGVQRDGGAGVAEALADRRDRHAGGEELGGVVVAQVVQTELTLGQAAVRERPVVGAARA